MNYLLNCSKLYPRLLQQGRPKLVFFELKVAILSDQF